MGSMQGTRRSSLRAAVVGSGVAVALLVAACGGSGSSSGGITAGSGSIKVDDQLQGKTLTVGSKEFTEQLVLGQITLDVLQAAGAKTVDKTNIKGSTAARDALKSGKTDMYWEYTGTGWITYLNHTDHFADQTQQFQATAQDDLQKNQIKWFNPTPFNDTYAMATTESTAKKLNVHTLSDVARLSQEKPSQATFCIESEFSTRSDGFPGMNKLYGIQTDPNNVKQMQAGVVYTQTSKGTCNFGEVYTTDGRIHSLHLQTLTDDKHFFPNYNAALTMRQQVFNQYPSLQKLFQPIAQKLNDEEMIKLDSGVDVQGKTPKQVADQWMKDQGYIK